MILKYRDIPKYIHDNYTCVSYFDCLGFSFGLHTGYTLGEVEGAGSQVNLLLPLFSLHNSLHLALVCQVTEQLT